MSKLDRYVFEMCLRSCLFFLLIFTTVSWISKSLELFEEILLQGYEALVFFELAILSLPTSIAIALPVAAFAATVQITSRLRNESELTVIQSTGFSDWRITRAFAIFGCFVGIFALFLTNFLIPFAGSQSKEREFELAKQQSSLPLEAGYFIHPMEGITVFFDDMLPNGNMLGFYLNDSREANRIYTVTAATAYVFDDVNGSTLAMTDGLIQTFDLIENSMAFTEFLEATYVLGELDKNVVKDRPLIYYMPTRSLWLNPIEASKQSGVSVAHVLEDLHRRFQYALLCVIASILGCSTILMARFSRNGVGWQIGFAIFILVFIKLVESAATKIARASPELWPFVYLPSIIGLCVICTMLFLRSRPRQNINRKYLLTGKK